MVFTKLGCGFVKFECPIFCDFFFFRKFQIIQIIPCSPWKKLKPQLSGKRAIVERHEGNLGLVGSSSTNIAL